MRIATYLAVGLLGALVASPALASNGEWRFTANPQQTDQGKHCWMGIGLGGQKLSIHATAQLGNFIGVEAPGLGGLAAAEEGTFTIAAGTPAAKRFSLTWNRGSNKTYVANGISQEGIVAVLKGLVFSDTLADNVSVAVGSGGILTFPAGGAAKAAEGFAGCMDRL